MISDSLWSEANANRELGLADFQGNVVVVCGANDSSIERVRPLATHYAGERFVRFASIPCRDTSGDPWIMIIGPDGVVGFSGAHLDFDAAVAMIEAWKHAVPV